MTRSITPLTACFPILFLVLISINMACNGDEPIDSQDAQLDAEDGDLSQPRDDLADEPPLDATSPTDPAVDTAPQDASDLTEATDIPDDSQTATDLSDADPWPACQEVTFSYNGGDSTITSVHVAGSFNSWAETVEAGGWPLSDVAGNNVWTATHILEPGTYQYKFVIDGAWYYDETNPNRTSDGYGGYNSVLVVSCDEPEGPVSLRLIEHESDDSGIIRATVRLVPEQNTLDPATIQLNLNHQPLQASDFSVVGNEVVIDLAGLPNGIHDLRVSAASTSGARAPFILLKFHLAVSTDWRDNVMYFVMTDRFRNGDPSNDSDLGPIEPVTDWYGGDFAGLIEVIEDNYFNDLGVSVLWISWPIENFGGYHEGPRPSQHQCNLDPNSMSTTNTTYTAYHGYWPSDIYAVDPRFGTLEELQELVDAAHARGIRIMLDFTANHVHSSSPFFDEFRDEYFNWPYSGHEHVCSQVGWDTEPETCWFTEYLADLDYRNSDASNAVVDMAFYWIRETGADGLRVDAVKHMNRDFLHILRRRLSEEIELTGIPFYLVGETFTGSTELINSYIGDTMLHGQFDFPLNHAILRAFATRSLGLNELDGIARSIKAAYGDGLMSSFIGNHDIARFVSMAGGDIYCGVWDVTSNIAQGWLYPPGPPSAETGYRLLRLAFTFIMTIPGVPLIYYGDEFGLPGAGDPDNRRPMRFGGELSTWERETLAFMQRLGEARAAHPSLRTGTWGDELWVENDVLAYPRIGSTETTIVVLNRAEAPRTLSISVAGLGISDGSVLRDALQSIPGSVTVSAQTANFTIPALSAAILVRD